MDARYTDADVFWQMFWRYSIRATSAIALAKTAGTVVFALGVGCTVDVRWRWHAVPTLSFAGLGDVDLAFIVAFGTWLAVAAMIVVWLSAFVEQGNAMLPATEPPSFAPWLRDAQRSGALAGVLVGSVALGVTVAFEYVRARWWIGDFADVRPHRVVAVIAAIPVVALVWCVAGRRWTTPRHLACTNLAPPHL
jgi:hypothetical protein